MDLKQVDFTKRMYRSDAIFDKDYLLGMYGDKKANMGKIDFNLIKDGVVEKDLLDVPYNVSQFPGKTEISLFHLNYPKLDDQLLISYGVITSHDNGSCFTSPAKATKDILGLKLNKEGPGSRIGLSIQSSKGNIWSFGGYPFGVNNSTGDRYFYMFNSTSNNWIDKTDLAIKANIPSLVYHTMSIINDEYLVIIGGGSFNSNGILVDSPFNKVYKFNLKQETWSTEELVNCPKYTKLGHTTTKFNDKLIVIGGVDNQEESKINMYTDTYSIDPNTLTCSQLSIKYDNGVSSTFQKAFHSTLQQDNYLLILNGMYSNTKELVTIIIDTNTWTRKFQYKNLVIPDELIPAEALNQPKSNNNNNSTDTIIFSVVGAILFFILVGLFYWYLIIKRRKKRLLASELLPNNRNSFISPMVHWVRSDDSSIQFDNKIIFSLENKSSAQIHTESSMNTDLSELKLPHFDFKINSINNNNQKGNDNYEPSMSNTLENSTIINNETSITISDKTLIYTNISK